MRARSSFSTILAAVSLACATETPLGEPATGSSGSTTGEEDESTTTAGPQDASSGESSGAQETSSTGDAPGCSWSGLGPAVQIDDTPAVRVELVDLDDDGRLDLVAGGLLGLRVLRGAGDGTFAESDARELAGPPRGFAWADFDGDGLLDLAASTGQPPMRVFPGRGDGTFGDAVVAWDLVGVELNGLAAGDFDADGDADVVIALEGAGPGFAWGNGDGTFAPEALEAAAVSQDVVVVDASGSEPVVLALSGYGTGTVSVARGGDYTAHPAAGAGRNLAALDLDAGGLVDLVTANDGQISVLRGTDDGFAAALELEAPSPVFRFEAGDLDCDGLGDLAVVPLQGGELIVLRGTNDDGFGFEEAARVPTATAPVAVAVGDVDGDGRLDVVVAGSEGGDTSGPVVHLGLP